MLHLPHKKNVNFFFYRNPLEKCKLHSTEIHFLSTRLSKLQKFESILHHQDCRETSTLKHLWLECKLMWSLLRRKLVLYFKKKLQMCLLFTSAIPLLSIFLKIYFKKHKIAYIQGNNEGFFVIPNNWKQLKCPLKMTG